MQKRRRDVPRKEPGGRQGNQLDCPYYCDGPSFVAAKPRGLFDSPSGVERAVHSDHRPTALRCAPPHNKDRHARSVNDAAGYAAHQESPEGAMALHPSTIRLVKERFSASRMATDYERVYRQLIEASRAAD